MEHLILLSGWKGHGKSYLAQKIAFQDFNEKDSVIKSLLKTVEPYQILSFAESLKQEVHNHLCLTEFEIEKIVKDQLLPLQLQKGECQTLRDYYKSFALSKKQNDPCYYASQVYQKIINQKIKYAVIDDFRFLEEYQLLSRQDLNITTIRITRTEIPIPAAEDVSEHQLDDFKFDYYL